ncbi:MAG: hypothetical protein ISS61_14785 [Desulfobacteraceae bacterium]|nr:hypothetical protein [Desulfobacteraceae bacterium]
MADRVLFIGWNHPVVGREQQAMELFQKVVEFYGKLQADGRIESFEPVILAAHGGDLNRFFLLKGEAGKLAELREDDAFVQIVMEAGYWQGYRQGTGWSLSKCCHRSSQQGED